MRKNKMWLLFGMLALVLSGVTQRYVERRRLDLNLTWSDPEGKNALEAGFMALGGFRGLLADILWMRAIRFQDSARYYELKLLCDLIQKLQPTFTQIHAFQAHNMSFNLANRAGTCEDKWYWIRSGISVLEKGLDRNTRSYALWFELGHQYAFRLSDSQMGDCKFIRNDELPNIDELTEDQCHAVFIGPKTWVSGHARPDEHLRFAAYYMWKAMNTGTDPSPIRTERVYGLCIERIGNWISKRPPAERLHWDDWGAEDWWVEIRNRNEQRGRGGDECAFHLRDCMYQQMNFYSKKGEVARQAAGSSLSDYDKRARAAYDRFQRYFPEDKRTFEEVLTKYRAELAKRPMH